MTMGLLAKTALFPLHLWLPPAHAGAPAPGSAVLSALVVKGSFFLIVRLWFDAMPGLMDLAAAQMLGTLGSGAILFGSMLALRQKRLKLLIAYSTIAQIGYLFFIFPLALGAAASNPWSGFAWTGGWLQLFSHAFAKAAMFMAAGLIAETLGHDRIAQFGGIGRVLPITMFTFGLAGLSLMGVPPSGGFVAKVLLLRASVMEGQWWWAAVMLVGGLLAGGYVFMVLGKAFSSAGASLRFARRCRAAVKSCRWRWRFARSCSVSSLCNRPICCKSAALRRSRWRRHEFRAAAHDAIDQALNITGVQAMTNSGMLIAATLMLPLAMLAACVSQRLRDRMPALLVFAPLPAIAAALQEFQGFNGTILVLPKALLGLTFELDRPGAMLLGASALLWTAAGAYAAHLSARQAGWRTFRGLVAGDAHRQPRRLHRRRRGELLLVLHAGQSCGLWSCHI